jgi:hypothetical protein
VRVRSEVSEQWFPPSQLAFYFDSNAWAKGTALYLQNDDIVAQLSPEADGWKLVAQVPELQASPFTVTAHLRVSEGGNLQAWRSTCSCSVGRMCKHGAALGIHVAMQGRSLREDARDEDETGELSEQQLQARQERAIQQSEYQVRDWLGRLETADVAQHFSLPSSTPEHFLYCMSVDTAGQRPVFHLTIKRAILKREGLWGKPKKVTTEPFAHDPIWQGSAANERGIFDLFKACPATNSFGSYGFHSAVKLQGLAAELLLQKCSETGRLMWEDDKAMTPLQWTDDALTISGSWQAVPEQDGAPAGWRLHMQAGPEGVVHGLNEPPIFVDVARGRCGRLDTQGLSAERLLLLTQSPVLPERVALKFQQQLMERLGPMPLPPVIEQLPEIRGVEPVGVLRISAVPLQKRMDHGIFQAQLTFDYDGQQGHWAHAQRRVALGKGASARMLLRDLAAEQRIVETLEDLGFDVAQGATLSLTGSQSAALWLEWLESDFEPLREAGLEVHTDSGLNTWLRLADDVHIDLSGEDGFDETSPWFNLSLGMDIDGQRVNILPWVPAILAALAGVKNAGDPTDMQGLPAHLYLPDLQGPGYVRLPTARIKPLSLIHI